MTEYRFEHAPQATRGRVIVRVINAGTSAHEFTMVRLGPDQFVTAERRVRGQALTTVVVLPTSVGDGHTFAADLLPGRYGFICFTKDADGVQHWDKGMASELVVV